MPERTNRSERGKINEDRMGIFYKLEHFMKVKDGMNDLKIDLDFIIWF